MSSPPGGRCRGRTGTAKAWDGAPSTQATRSHAAPSNVSVTGLLGFCR